MPTFHSVRHTQILHELLHLHEAAVVGINGATQKLFAHGRSTIAGRSAHGFFFVWSDRENRDKIPAWAPTQKTFKGIDMSAAPSGTSSLDPSMCGRHYYSSQLPRNVTFIPRKCTDSRAPPAQAGPVGVQKHLNISKTEVVDAHGLDPLIQLY
jgi:hypothetical protein